MGVNGREERRGEKTDTKIERIDRVEKEKRRVP